MDHLLATRFNVLEYIRPDENGLSDLIADLLDANGKHGQGESFVRAFVEIVCGVKAVTWTFHSVRREVSTAFIAKTQRRLDVLLDLESFGMVIENKPWANDQPQQIHDYVAHLKLCFAGQYILVYLSRDGAKPTSIDDELAEQLISEGRLVLCAYGGRFYDWLQRCHQVCAAEKVRWFLFDFMTYVEQKFPLRLTSVK